MGIDVYMWVAIRVCLSVTGDYKVNSLYKLSRRNMYTTAGKKSKRVFGSVVKACTTVNVI